MNLNPTLADVGELRVIEEIVKVAPSSLNGDDAAVLGRAAPNHRTVAATDMMVEGRHFRLDWSTPEEIGQKAIVRNFADVEAMGARPTAALLAIAAPKSTPLAVIQGIARGVADRCGHYHAELVGGDLTEAHELILNVTALGALGGDRRPLTLGGARSQQQVVAHGKIGWAGAGLALLERFGRDLPASLTELWPLIEAQCAPWLKPGRGVIARATGATSMTDNSDGLIPDLTTLARRSGVHIDLDRDAIAPDALLTQAGEVLGRDPWEWVLTSGEDHTLMGTTAKDAPSGFKVIGRVVGSNGKAAGRGTHASSGDAPAPWVTVGGQAAGYSDGWLSFRQG